MQISALATAATVASSLYYSKKSSDIQEEILADSQASEEAAYELEKAETESTLAEQQRVNANLLEEEMSSYKALLGANGISSQSGSGQAVLDQMEKEYEAEDKYLVNQSNISLDSLLNAIEQSSSNTNSYLDLYSTSTDSNLWSSLSMISRSLLK